MKERIVLSERYNEAVSKIHASDALVRKVEAMNNDKKVSKKTVVRRRALIAAAVAAALLVLSNVAVFAATGETWVEKLFWYDKKPAQPMENVHDFFNANASVLGETGGGTAANRFYGGTYLDRETGEQVILLTDLSKIGEFTDVPENVRFEKCNYTFAELSDEIKLINVKLGRLKDRNEGYAADVVAWGLHDMENRLFIDIYRMNDEKVQWFKENVSNKSYLVFNNAESFPQDGVD